MGLARLLAAGTIGYVVYRAWKHYRDTPAPPLDDNMQERTPPHGDPVLASAAIDIDTPSRPAAQSSMGFGEA